MRRAGDTEGWSAGHCVGNGGHHGLWGCLRTVEWALLWVVQNHDGGIWTVERRRVAMSPFLSVSEILTRWPLGPKCIKKSWNGPS
jgi:hypothetical protein